MSMRRSFSSIVDLLLGVVEERGDLEGGKARLAAVLGVERRHPHQPVHAALGTEQPVGVAPSDDERRRQDARLAAGGDLVELDLEAAPLRPAQVHPQHHLRPVLRVGATGAGVDLGDRVALVVLAGEQAAQLERRRARCASTARFVLELAARRSTRSLPLVVGAELEQGLRVVDAALEAARSRRCRPCARP